MINLAFEAYVENMGGADVIYAFLGAGLAFIIVISIIDYIID